MAHQTETFGFQTEVTELLRLVTHSLYSNKEIFLRELISNAFDAIEKLRFEALTDAALFENDGELKIWVEFDAKAHTITVRDNGIGMSRDEVITNLGTIAKSGTREFIAALTGDAAKDARLIGQFGVGFYSSFVVADKVVVETRRAGMRADQGICWESAGTGEYTIQMSDRPERGTKVILYLKEEDYEFADAWRLRSIISKYSSYIDAPILLPKAAAAATDEDKDKAVAEETAKPEYEVINQATALWTLAKKDITDEQYNEFYKQIAHDFEAPLETIHKRIEGNNEYTLLLYLPARAPFDLWNYEKKHGLKLYVQRVFIMDDAEQLLPNYLRFVRGVVDSKNLPLNVSREILQSNKVIDSIRGGIIKRVLETLQKISENDKEKYAKFWQAFGRVMKEGLVEDFSNKDAIAKLLRFASTHADSDAQDVALDDYIARMPAEQDKIYYITAETFLAAKNSPHLEIFRKKNIEVLLLSDRVDEWMLSALTEFNGKKLQSVAKGDLELGKLEDKEAQQETEKAKNELESVLKHMQTVLGDKVKEVRVTHRLTDSPACLVTSENEMSIHLQRLMQSAGQQLPTTNPILEINPEHPIIQRLRGEVDDQRFADWVNVLFEQAYLAESGKLDDPGSFVKRLNKLILQLV